MKMGFLSLYCIILCIFHVGFSFDFRIMHRFNNKKDIDYHKVIVKHDLIRHGRELLYNDTLVFSQGNFTEDLGPKFGGIHYTFVDIGTPNKSFLVALDTGSDLFWVPCDCKQCESVSPSKYPELRHQLTTFNTNASSSSKPLTCNSRLCNSNACTNGSSVCPYTVRYLSENTSTSGKLVQDVIHLLNPLTNTRTTSPIIFGCGEEQTGLFLRGGAPNGLLGLGPGEVSLPSLLAKDGIINDTFSMCFDADGTGRLLFGDRGAKTQQTTQFFTNGGQRNAYDVSVEEIVVGNHSIRTSFTALFDTGTTLTYLQPEAYTTVTNAFRSQVSLRRISNQNLDPYEFCYQLNGDEKDVPAPSISITFAGGGNFSVNDPFIYLVGSGSESKIDGFCLAVIKSNIPIIGQNFMGGYRLSFDRELTRLGWSPADCYKLEDSATVVRNTTSPPSVGQPPSRDQSDGGSPFLRPKDQNPRPTSSDAIEHRPLLILLLFLYLLN